MRAGTLEVTNLTPYPVLIALRYEWRADSVVTEGWYRLEAGETRTFVRRFRGVAPAFQVHGHSAAPAEHIRWLHGLPDSSSGRVYFSGPFEGLVVAGVSSFRTPVGASAAAAFPAVSVVGFEAAVLERRRHRFVLEDALFNSVYAEAGEGAFADQVAETADRIARLEPVLFTQHWFDGAFPDPEQSFPYDVAVLGDRNGPFVVGVDIDGAYSFTIWGDTFPLRTGDRLLSLGGQEVYSPYDLWARLWFHATDTLRGGIRKPLAFTAMRDGREISGETSFFFNEGYFGRSERDRDRATGAGFVNGVFLGFGCQGSTGVKRFGRWLAGRSSEFSAAREVWTCHQDNARLMQFYGEDYHAGGVVSLLVPGLGVVATAKVARGLRLAGVPRAFAVPLAGGAVAVVEGTVYHLATASPFQDREATLAELRSRVPVMAGAGVVMASLSPLQRR